MKESKQLQLLSSDIKGSNNTGNQWQGKKQKLEQHRSRYQLQGNNNPNSLVGKYNTSNTQGDDNINIQGNSNTIVHGDLIQHFHSADETVKELLQIIVEQNKQIIALTTRLLKNTAKQAITME